MGVPIIINKNGNDIKSNNGYVQYQTKNEKHIIPNNKNFIRYSTDGILYEQITNNYILKKHVDKIEKRI